MATVYPLFVGQRALIEIIFRLNGVPTDPTVVTCTSRSPSGVQSTITYPVSTFIRRSEGQFEASILVDEPGDWTIRAEAAGIVDAVNEYNLSVTASGLV